MSPTRCAAAVVSALLLTGSAGALYAQSLADVAKKEEERRKEVKQPSKTYTNKDLKPVPPSPPSETAQAPAAAAGEPADAATAKSADDASKPEADKAKTEPVKDQAYWAGRLKGLQTQLDRDQSYFDALQSRINALTADFTARDDPAQRAQIAADRQKALDELGRLKQALQDDRKALSDLDEEARRAGVPPGWLR